MSRRHQPSIWRVIVWLCLWAAAASTSADPVYPGQAWESAAPADAGLDEAKLHRARDYALTGGGSGMVVRGGRVVLTWGDLSQRYDLKSTSKSVGVTALGVALADGKVKLTDRAVDLHPTFATPPEENARTGWPGEITLLHLATQTAGFEKPGGYGKILFKPGSQWLYSDAGPNWLAECLTLAYRRDVRDLLFERVFTPIGIRPDGLTWRNNQYRPHQIDGIPRREFGSGIHANVDAMARLGYLYLREGKWKDQQLLPESFVEQARATVPGVVGLPEYKGDPHDNASDHYGLLWWNNADGTLKNVPRDAYWSWGLYDNLIVVIPSLDVVVARAGKSWKRDEGGGHYDVLAPFLDPIVSAVTDKAPATAKSQALRRIRSIEWAPPETIRRAAPGSDNWPMTWADDGSLFTAYGDGWGFDPRVPKKLSLGFARITGGPDDFAAENVRSDTGEQFGDGPRGKKASGLLMVDGVLYMWVRNAGNAQLAWSKDRGRSWTWADWKFDTSFGCPTFLNFGQNYDGARDGYVYVFSPDRDDAYTPADRAVLARVPKGRIGERGAYEFFEGVGADDEPRWTADVTRRGVVLERKGGCSRFGITYNAPLKSYLWVTTLKQVSPGTKPDDASGWAGLAVYQAPEPWGPWTGVYEAERWDVHPGDSASFPTKWISEDGRTAHLVFAGDDSFAVRRATLALAE